jgi:hypothetical protein
MSVINRREESVTRKVSKIAFEKCMCSKWNAPSWSIGSIGSRESFFYYYWWGGTECLGIY